MHSKAEQHLWYFKHYKMLQQARFDMVNFDETVKSSRVYNIHQCLS